MAQGTGIGIRESNDFTRYLDPHGLMQPSLRVVLLSTSAGINYIRKMEGG